MNNLLKITNLSFKYEDEYILKNIKCKAYFTFLLEVDEKRFEEKKVNLLAIITKY